MLLPRSTTKDAPDDLAEAGQVLSLGLLDAQVWQPERLDFAAGPTPHNARHSAPQAHGIGVGPGLKIEPGMSRDGFASAASESRLLAPTRPPADPEDHPVRACSPRGGWWVGGSPTPAE